MPGLGTVWLNVKPDLTGFGAALKGEAGASADTAGKSLGQRMGSNLGGQVKKYAAGAIAGLSVAGAASLIKGSISVAREAAKVQRQTEAGIRSTGGAANVSAGQVEALGHSLSRMSGVDHDVIQQGDNLLLTFKNVRNAAGSGNDVFNQATKAALDLSAKGFGSMTGASKMIGKALNDPIKGLGALGRAGVKFTADQQAQIKTLVQSGDLLGAQKIVLEQVQSRVGGAAKAAADPMSKLKVSFKDMKESIGNVLLPVLNKIVPLLQDVADWAGRNMKIIAPLAVIFGALATAIGLIIAAMKIWEITTKAMEAVQAAFNVVMDANPIVLIIIAVVALVAAIVLLWKHSETFRDVVIAVWNAIKVAAEAVWNAIKVVITVVIDAIVLYVKTYIFVIKTVFEAVWTAVKWVVSTAIDFVKATIQAGVAAVLGIWHGIVKIVDFVKEAFDKVKKAVGDVVSFFENLGHDIIHGIWTGITKAAGWLADKFKGLAKTVAGPFAKVLGISSPSKLFAEYGLEIVRGLAGGMDSNAPIAVAAATRLASGLAPTPAGPAGGGGNVLPALAGAPASVSIVQNIDGALDPAVVGRVASNEIAWALRTTRS